MDSDRAFDEKKSVKSVKLRIKVLYFLFISLGRFRFSFKPLFRFSRFFAKFEIFTKTFCFLHYK
ncbi:hypothetical protein LEP1GSC021_3583 [Leptospira noguchii str. 1993005606]|uniref:Uncharacterized protein n=1 Tax=Leptospira noguchii str. 2007001578 TaxID=1049974 RepID=A0ABN0IW18_9LEPT|nr:hypothetical protein LEP1GSC035_4374 [Leptospira noguchii str. 2007001578]EPE83256.1 hypothetical protein LEP1GSC021_3583 [Leptospira noguchii str. 1993005606]